MHKPSIDVILFGSDGQFRHDEHSEKPVGRVERASCISGDRTSVKVSEFAQTQRWPDATFHMREIHLTDEELNGLAQRCRDGVGTTDGGHLIHHHLVVGEGTVCKNGDAPQGRQEILDDLQYTHSTMQMNG